MSEFETTGLLIKKIPPHNLAAERAALGTIMLEGTSAFARIARRLQPTDFYKEGHRVLYRRMVSLSEAERAIDSLTLQDALLQAGEIDEIGGPVMLAGLIEEAAVSVHLDDYVEIILRDAAKREMIAALATAIGAVYQNGKGPADLATGTAETLAKIAERADPAMGARVITPIPVGVVLRDLVGRLGGTAETDFVPSPVPELNDRLGGGLLPGEVVTLGGRPGTAKTALAVQWAALAATLGHRTLVVSREMRNAALGRRLLAQQAQVNATSLRRRDVDEAELIRIRRALPRLAGLPLWFADQAETIGEIWRLARTGHYRLIIVDYLQLVRSPADSKNRRLEVTAVSGTLKRLAMRFGPSVVTLSSLRRPEIERRKRQPPSLEDLKESGDIEADSDVVLLLHQPKPDSSDRELLFAKLREGETGGHVTLAFTPMYVRFTEVPAEREPGEDDVVPF